MAYDMASSYDENLMDNTFFQTLQRNFSQLFLKAISEGCIICVPRMGSFSKNLLTLEDFLSHIVVPTDELPESHFINLCGAEIKINNGIITVDHEVGYQSSVHILFQETFYTKEGLRHEVLCVEQLFRSDTNFSNCQNGLAVLKNLRDCLDLLWTESGNNETIENIDKEIGNFLKKNNFDSDSVQEIKDLASSLYVKCMKVLLGNSNFKKKCKTQKHTLNNLKIAVEAYMQHSIYKNIIKSISNCTAFDDAHLNKKIRNFSDFHLKDFNIECDFYTCIPKARLELSRMNGYSTTLGKIGCLKRTLAALTDSKTNKLALTADDLLQILSFLIIKTNVPNWNAQLVFLKSFQFSNSLNLDEGNFLITSLEAAITYLQKGIFCHVNQEDICGQQENVKSNEIHSLKEDCEKNTANEKTIHQFFHHIALGDLKKVKEIIETSDTAPQDYSSLNLCHPLCTCERCSLLIQKNFCEVTPTVNSCDEQGLTAIHVASMYGEPNLVEYFLAHGADPNIPDYDGRTPVHYASLRGHQSALLLLVHKDADVNALDNSSNTPLHLCANNGHESCVKALIYFSEYLGVKLKLNHQNIKGETPLHNAAKWGYIGIVRILLEYGADPSIVNKRKFSPIDYAHNIKVLQLLKQKFQGVTNYIKIKPLNPSFDLCDQSGDHLKNQIYKGIQPTSMHVMKQVEKVLKATENGDINLVCFYLNIDVSEFKKNCEVVGGSSKRDTNNENGKCHPLCSCTKCGLSEGENFQQQNETKQFKKKGLNINICNSEGYTPLHAASKYGHIDLVRGFVKNGALLNAQTSNLVTPLMLACQSEKINVVKELLDSGCQIDMQDRRSNTALHYACYIGNKKLVETLLKYEPNITLKNVENRTALSIAKENMFMGIIKILKGGKEFNLLNDADN